MRSSFLALALAIASSAAAASDPVLGVHEARRDAPSSTYRDGEVIVHFKEPMNGGIRTSLVREAGGDFSRESIDKATLLVELAPGISVDEALRRFSSMPEVAFAERNGIVRKSAGTTFTPNDTYFEFQWSLKMLDAERIWGIQKGSSSVAVAVIDTGVAYEDRGPYRKAPDFGGTKFLPGYDFVNDDPYPNDDDGHGTHVASVIAESTNNSLGMAGLAFGCAILPIKALDWEGEGSYFDVAQAIDFATHFSEGGVNPVRVINLSLGGEDYSETVKRAIDTAHAKGILVVAASGNSGRAVEFPASLDNVLAVGSVDARKEVASYSSFGRQLDLVAPGGDCDRDDNSDGFGDCIFQQSLDPRAVAAGRFDVFGYFGFDGTSMAAPHVSASAALLYSQGITDPSAVRSALEQTADPLSAQIGARTDASGYGLIQPVKALSGLGFNQGFQGK